MDGLWCLEQATVHGPRYRVCVPKNRRWAAIAMVHDSPDGGGHFGGKKTLEKLEKRFYWPTLRQDLKDYIKTCRECQFSNRRQNRHLGPMQSIVATRPMEIIAADVVGPLPLTKRKNR